MCDLTDDCGDNTDETDSKCANYIRNDFESGFQEWANVVSVAATHCI